MPEIGDIGATLRETRMRARIDIGEVEMRTKIRAKYLRAIENEEWDLLPGPVYVKSFLRTYGEYLGLDSRLLVDEYKRRYELAGEPHRPLSPVKRERERERAGRRRLRGPVVPSWAIILLVVVAAGAVLYLIGRKQGGSGAATTGSTAHAGLSRTRTTPPATHTATTPARKVAAAPRLATLKLAPTGSVWMCVEYKNGRRLINGVSASAGQSFPTLKGSELLVRLGNANVTVTANGRPYPLSASATAIGLKITPHGVTPDPQAPTCA